ncbi:MAG TPA: hypothetical protein VGJ87_00675, partial [Roseiflexaceae bacterium]
QALARLSVFRGALDRAAAQAVALTPVTLLAALVDASLLRHLGVGRYGFHELVRQFAAARLAEFGEAEALAERHAGYYLELLAEQEAALYGDAPQTAAAVIRDAADNLRQAWDWAVAHSAWDGIARSLRHCASMPGSTACFMSMHRASQRPRSGSTRSSEGPNSPRSTPYCSAGCAARKRTFWSGGRHARWQWQSRARQSPARPRQATPSAKPTATCS